MAFKAKEFPPNKQNLYPFIIVNQIDFKNTVPGLDSGISWRFPWTDPPSPQPLHGTSSASQESGAITPTV